MDQITEFEFENKILGGGLFDFVKKTYNNIADRFRGKRLNSFNNESTKTLKDYGNEKIFKLTIAKKPIHAVLDRFINILSFNKWDSLKNKYGFDKMFHLCLIATLESGKKIYIEKIDALTISTVDKISGNDTQYLEVNDIPNISLNELMYKTRNEVGDNLFFDYHPFKNNCQNLVSYLLKSISKYGDNEKNFIYQDVSEIAKELSPITKGIMKGITDLGQIGNRFLGRGEYILVKVIIRNPKKEQLDKLKYPYTKRGNIYTVIINDIKGNKRVKYGKLTFIYSSKKTGGKVDIKLKERLPKLEQEAYKFLGSIPKMEVYKPTDRKDFKNLRIEWERDNRPEMIKILNMGKEDRQKYKEQKIKEFNEWKKTNKDYIEKEAKQRETDIKNVDKAKKVYHLRQLIDAIRKRKEEADKVDNPNIRQNLINQYNHDQKMVEEYNFYKVDNTLLRDQLEKQYLKMFNNMLTKPKIYGFLKEGTIKRTDPDTIRYVYEHYGKPDFNWDSFINDSLPSILNEGLKMIPGVGQIYKPIGDAIIEANDEDNAKRGAVSEADILPDIDYSKGYELFDKSNEQANKERADLNLEEQKLREQEKSIIGSGFNWKLYLYTINKIAKKNGYNKGVKLSDDKNYKLVYDGVKFGKKDNLDYILYWMKYNKETAKKHREAYLKRSSKIRGNWKDNKLSPNNLSRIITWDLNNVL